MRAIEKNIIKIINQEEPEIIDFVRSLIKYPSINEPPNGREAACQEFIRKKLKELELEVDFFTPNEVEGIRGHPAFAPHGGSGPERKYDDRPNVVGVWKGKHDGRGIILNGHIDVFPVISVKDWTHDPWAADIQNGEIYGRGAVDMKGGLGAMLMAIYCLKEVGIKPMGDVIFESVVDEEFGGGNGTLATILRGYKADVAIVGEPSGLSICPAGYGGFLFDVEVKGRNAHPFFKKQGQNAIEKGIKIVNALIKLEKSRSQVARKAPLFTGYDPSSPIMIRSLNTGELTGGGLATTCIIRAWAATIPEEKREDVLTQFIGIIQDTVKDDPWLLQNPPEITCLGRYLEPWKTDSNDPIIGILKSTIKDVTFKKARLTAGLTCDAFLFKKYAKIPCIIIGPGSAISAHNNDESILIEELISATKIYALTILKWCGY